MKAFISKYRSSQQVGSEALSKYRLLQKHLNKMPIGYPATRSGVELRLLSAMFTTEEAEAAILLNWMPRRLSEIQEDANSKGYDKEEFLKLIKSMESKGCIFATTEGEELCYSLHPLYIGMYEMYLRRLTPGYYLDLREYTFKRFFAEYLTTEARQMRVIPISKSVETPIKVSAYDDIRGIIDRAKDRIVIADCICRLAKDSLGKPCKKTDRRETCMFFRDYSDTFSRYQWGRKISKDEAFEILDQSEKDGLILMTSSWQEQQYVCSCCSCCCGLQELVGMFPRPVDFVESNYYAQLDTETCKECGKCEKLCQLNAIKIEGKKAIAIDERRCVGCGVCVSSCKSGALRLVKKEKEFIPPKDIHAYMEFIDANRKGMSGKIYTMLKAVTGFKV